MMVRLRKRSIGIALEKRYALLKTQTKGVGDSVSIFPVNAENDQQKDTSVGDTEQIYLTIVF